MPFSKTIALPTGSLKIQINETEDLFNQYIDFAARNNPKRGFLFVSKVLAKHYPCTPTQMRVSYHQLVDLLLAIEMGSDKFVFIGMAETATALGLGVYETWLKQTQKQGVYCQTTRYFLDNHPFVNFEETHSHATGFYLYQPENDAVKKVFNHADTLVLIDDEISTGNTFVNLINAYKKLNPDLKRVIVISLLNLTNELTRNNMTVKTGITITWLSILSGCFEFTPNPEFAFNAEKVESNQHCKQHLFNGNYGRLGINNLLPSLTGQLAFLAANFKAESRLLLVGTGEFIYYAYLVATELENQGFKTYVQSTTRSPILISHAILNAEIFQDNYEDQIINYLYNTQVVKYDAIIIVHETPKNSALVYLTSFLKATSLRINHGKVCLS